MRVLVVGLGLVGRRHIDNLRALVPDAEIAVWRQTLEYVNLMPMPPKLDGWFFSVPQIQAWQPDVAIVANPASMRPWTALTLAECGAHLFLEKPIAASLDGVDRLLAACRERGRVLMVGYDLRCYHPLQTVKQAIDAGRIGRPTAIRCEVGQYLPDWRPGRDYRKSVSAQAALGGGVILELSHEIDYARWLMGEVASVAAMMGTVSDLEVEAEDTADILLRFESGALGSIHLDMTDRAPVRRCRVVGTDGTIACDLRIGRVAMPRAATDPPVGTVQYIDYPDGAGDPFLAEMRHFLACCRGEAVPPVGGDAGRRVLEIVLAAKRSAEEGMVVEL